MDLRMGKPPVVRYYRNCDSIMVAQVMGGSKPLLVSQMLERRADETG
jgi:hypothetical protein